MNEYYRLADEYFDAFESRKLYPTWRTWHWYAWLASLVALALYVYRESGLMTGAVGNVSTLLMLAIDLCIVITSSQITAFKERSVLTAARADYGQTFVSLEDCRRTLLENLRRTTADNFAASAKTVFRPSCLAENTPVAQ